MFTIFINWVLNITAGLGYVGVFVLMAVESSFLPFPSELAIPPAAWLASQGQMNIFLIVILGTLGSVLGAMVNYFLALWLGRPAVYKLMDTKFARLLHLNSHDLERAEAKFLKNANSATFVCRLIPVIRQLISIPAGFTKMPFLPFVSLTALGSLIWVSILAALGYTLGANQDLLSQYYSEIQWILLILGIIWLSHFFYKKHKKKQI
jgi:membrane protein DedA with SNARE-associated domain